MKQLIAVAVILAACGQTAPTPSKAGAKVARFATQTCVPARSGALCSDLLTAPVGAGAETTTTVTLPPGAVLVAGSISPTGDAVGKFDVESAQGSDRGSDGVELDVRAKNIGQAEARFSANFSYTVGPGQ